MFQMFGFGGAKCPRCDHKSDAAAGYCARCGLTLGAAPNAPLLRENRWVPGADELAVFFGVRALSGVFVKTLRVPATARAYILQGGKATEVPQGEYEIEGFFTRLNHLLRDQHAEILVTRTSALAVEFDFDGLRTAENLLVAARFTVSVAIEQVPAFARHFMTMPGTVTTAQLRELLAPSVRQLAAEFVAGQSLRDMAKNPELRPQLDERLQGALKMRLAQFGLAVVQVDTLALRHDRFDANRERIGSLWLATDERHVQLEHAKQLDELYSEEQWRQIRREEHESRLRFRRTEMRQGETLERAGLTLQNSERAQAIRAREIELYARVVEATSRKQALERGAGDVLAELEHEFAKKGAARADQAGEWEHLRGLARIRMQTELEVAQQDALQARQLAQQRFSHQLMQQQIQNKVAQALAIEDEARKRAELARLHAHQQEVARREQELEAEEHQARVQSLALENAGRKRELERVAEWDEQLALVRQRELLRKESLQAEDVTQKLEAMRRGGATADAVAQYEKLLRTIDADGRHERQAQQIALEAEEQRHARKREEQEAQWQHELRRADRFGALSDSAKLALAAAPNAAILADYMKTQLHAGMSPPQLAALSGVVAAGAGVPTDERTRRDAEIDKDRRHLLALQGGVPKAAIAGPRCPHGHPGAMHDRFCGQCGAALQP